MKYLKITSPDIENGSGCRATLWIPGCAHKCVGCHNEWTQDYNQGKEFTLDTYSELINILRLPYISGLTISGGDPLMQNDDTLIDLCQLVFDIKNEFPNKNIWLYTGYYIDELKDIQLDIIKYCDTVVEGPFEIDKLNANLPFRGSDNQNIINVNKY